MVQDGPTDQMLSKLSLRLCLGIKMMSEKPNCLLNKYPIASKIIWTGDKNVSILHLSCKTSDLQF